MTERIPRIAVIGGGASGLMAAVTAAREAERQNKKICVQIFEAADRAGKKLLVTGNGRCNLTNLNISPAGYYGAVKLFGSVYPLFTAKDTLAFFIGLGVHTFADEEGRVYPRSQKAASVLNPLLYECGHLSVEIFTDTKIESIRKTERGFLLNGRYTADGVILSAGGRIGASGKNTDGLFPALKACGVSVSPLRPALTAFTVRDFTKSLKGVRAAGRLTLLENGREVAAEEGEIQYTEYGISGIPAMQLSSHAARSAAPDNLTLATDSAPDIPAQTLQTELEKLRAQRPDMPLLLYLTGFVPKPLGEFFAKTAGISASAFLGDLLPEDLRKLIGAVKSAAYPVKGLRGFEFAQVTSGGIMEEEISGSLMLKKLPGTYVCGEIVDIDGICGGYNLQWAWTSGAVAGKNCARRVL